MQMPWVPSLPHKRDGCRRAARPAADEGFHPFCHVMIDMTDCAADAVLFAVAVRAREMFAVASPIELYDRIKMLRGYITQQLQFRDDDDDDNNDRCPFQLLCMLLRDSFAPHLVLDPL